MASSGFKSFKRLPHIEHLEPSDTPHTKSPPLSTLRESKETSSTTKSNQSNRVREGDNSRTLSPNFDRNESSKISSRKFKRRRGTSKHDIDLDDIESKDKEKSISEKISGLLSINETKQKEKSISNKSIPQLLTTPIKHTNNSRSRSSYEQLIESEEDFDDSDDNEQDDITQDRMTNPTYTQDITHDRMTLVTNINDNTTDASNKRRKIFHRKRQRPKNVSVADDNDVSEDEISKSGTDLSALLSVSKSHKNSKKFKQNLASSLTSKTSVITEYSLKDELNLQKIIINATAEMHASVPLPDTLSRTEIDSCGETDSDDDSGGNGNKDTGKTFSELFKMKQKRNETLSGFEFYFKLRHVLSLLTLIATGTMQTVYYRYYYLSMMFTVVTSLFYTLLFMPQIYENLSKSNWFLFGLIVIRLFHIMCILLIFAGVETCVWHYELVLDIENSEFNGEYGYLFWILWVWIGLAIIICALQNVYVIEYVEYIIQQWKLIYCCRKKYYINDDGSWRGDINPISGWDGVLTFLLFITTFGAITTAVVCITQMEQDMNTYGI